MSQKSSSETGTEQVAQDSQDSSDETDGAAARRNRHAYTRDVVRIREQRGATNYTLSTIMKEARGETAPL